jgi:sugar phosphate isomerase/epimerase
MDWGGLSYEHTLRMLEDIDSPNLKLVFDTGNPVFLDDVRGKPPYSKQNSYEFYQAVKEHIEYIHIKDLYLKDGKEVYTFPGEGNGCVVEILTDLIKSGYDGGFSIEPHMETVFHDENDDTAGKEKARYRNYIEYGKRAMKIIEDIKQKI